MNSKRSYWPFALAFALFFMLLGVVVHPIIFWVGLVLVIGGECLSAVPIGQAALLAALGLVTWAMMAVTYMPVLRLNRLSAARAPSLPLAGLLYTAMTINSAWRHHRGRGGAWKGRTIQ